MQRWVNFISGGGSTNLAILEAEKKGGHLYGKSKTMAIISSSVDAGGIKKAIDAGFPAEHIHVVDPKVDLAGSLDRIIKRYRPAIFHQLGWTPLTPKEFLDHHVGLNQHLGPGGRYMKGRRRIWTHLRFSDSVGIDMRLPVFCQKVAEEYDAGGIVYIVYARIRPNETINDIAERLLPIEHGVQIEGRHRVSTGNFITQPVPKYARNEEEKKLLLNMQKESVKAYPNE